MLHKSIFVPWLAVGALLIGIAAIILCGLVLTRIDTVDVTPSPSKPAVAEFPLLIATDPTQTATKTATSTSTASLTPTHTASFTAKPPTLHGTPSTSESNTGPSPSGATSVPQESSSLSANECTIPDGWVQHTVEFGETLFAYQLGSDNSASVDDIITANCLEERWVYEGQTIWLPPGAAENAPPSYSVPTAYPDDPNAPPPPRGLTRTPNCPCTVTIRAGWRLEQIGELIDSLPVGFYASDLWVVAGPGASLPGHSYLAGATSLEGYMLPGSYTVTNAMDAVGFRDMVLEAFNGATAAFWGDAAARGFTPYQMVNLASVIIRESRSYDQQVLVSSVFHNRLAAGKGLGATVTLQYALGRPGNWWPNVHGLVSTTDSPYNTNMYVGLPPTPIANPTVDAIRAAVYPAQTNYYYFTGSCTGSGNAFAETYEQHLANVRCE